MKNLAFFSALVLCVIFGAVFLGIQSPMILSGGSTSLDTHIKPEPLQSWLSLGFFAVLLVILRFSGWFKGKVGAVIGAGLVFMSLVWIALNSHSFTISGRENAFINRWFLVPSGVLNFDPTGDISNYVVSDTGLFHSTISIKDSPQTKMVIVTGISGAGIDQAELTIYLERFGLSRPLTPH